MKVTSMTQYRSREAVTVLRHLLARAERGEIVGLALCAKPELGPEEIVFAGIYRTNPSSAVNASMRMSWRLTQLQDEIDAAHG
jgi:hypothetical protein